MIQMLNDDCQLLIINYLELMDQLALWEATEAIDSRLNRNVRYAWRHQLSYVLQQSTLNKLDLHPQQIEAFLSSISPTVQQLTLRYITARQLERWAGRIFPNMRILEYTLDDLQDAENTLELFVVIFPGLECVTPFGSIRGQDIAKWIKLRQLDLKESFLIDGFELWRNLQFLEELSIDCDSVTSAYINIILKMPKLRTLHLQIITKGETVLDQIIKHRGPDIQHLTFNDIIWAFKLTTLQEVTSLRQLTLLEDDGFPADQLHSLVMALPQLEQLNLINFQCWRSETELWQIVASCPTLSILNISGMQLYAEFFDLSRRSMEAALNKRSAPLFLHVHNTGPQTDLMHQRFKHSNFVVSFKPLKVDYIEERHMKIHFVPSLPSNS